VAQQIGIRAAIPVNNNNLRVTETHKKGYEESVSELPEVMMDVPSTNGNIIDVKLYPIPSNGLFTIQLPWDNAKDVEVSVYNANGTKVFNHLYGETGNKLLVDMSNNITGLYMVTIQFEGQSIVRKMIIQK
jgi:hypothetical protein